MDIKFRVWDNFQKKYVFEGFHVIGEVTVFGGIEDVVEKTWAERIKVRGYESRLQAYGDFVLEQFSGVCDNTGKEIYEGDILDYREECGANHVVEWLKEGMGMALTVACSGTLEMEKAKIIGNVHELEHW